ncbi:hypothetical protein ES702_03557 [subsurface metagenome]
MPSTLADPSRVKVVDGSEEGGFPTCHMPLSVRKLDAFVDTEEDASDAPERNVAKLPTKRIPFPFFACLRLSAASASNGWSRPSTYSSHASQWISDVKSARNSLDGSEFHGKALSLSLSLFNTHNTGSALDVQYLNPSMCGEELLTETLSKSFLEIAICSFASAMSRPLIPRPPSGEPENSISSPTAQKPKKISTACGSCKQRKTRVSNTRLINLYSTLILF